MPPSKQQLELFKTDQPKTEEVRPSINTANLPHAHPDLELSIKNWADAAIASVRKNANRLLASGRKLSAEEQADMVLKEAEAEFNDRGIRFVRVGTVLMAVPDGVSDEDARESLGYKKN